MPAEKHWRIFVSIDENISCIFITVSKKHKETNTMTNKELVLKFYDEVFNNWDISNLDNYMKDNYIQHNPTAPSGKEGFVEFTKFFFSLKPHMDIIHIGEDGDIVYVFFKCTLENGAINKVCDIYRIEDGQLAEHWDVVEHNVQDIVPVHNNGLF